MEAGTYKKTQLRKFRIIATSLLGIMAIVFAATFKMGDTIWVGYLRAFSEAAMVGALADWFAVTALFKHPLGIPIPHTNLIENSKEKIGDNLGSFVQDNFLTAENIKPRIIRLKVANALGNWLAQEKNSHYIADEITRTISDALNNLDDEQIITLLQKEATHWIQQISLPPLVGKMLRSVVEQELHQPWVTVVAKSLSHYMNTHKQWLKEKVHQESSMLIPGFVDKIVANKISKAAIIFFEEIANQPLHPMRQKLSGQLLIFSENIQQDEKWISEVEAIKKFLFNEDQLGAYTRQLWKYVKQKLQAATQSKQGVLHEYIVQRLQQIAHELQQDEARQKQTDAFVQKQLFQLIMRHRNEAAIFISQTVGNWKGRELSERLEWEVGKDLQFIRINGTVVGGLVGLLIHAIVEWIG